MSTSNSWHDVAALADIPEEGGLAVDVAGRTVAVFRQEGQVFAVEDSCPHRGGRLSDGIIRDGRVYCPLHAWCFNLETGCNEDEGPGVDTFAVQVDGNRVRVQATDPSD